MDNGRVGGVMDGIFCVAALKSDGYMDMAFTYSGSEATSGLAKVSEDRKVLYWYDKSTSAGASKQHNESGRTYIYTALG